ncbi:MAG: molybdopterin-dependent oxidoreductase [Anaerolineae bacterium]|nr:molybdopterin-dependent oxidoreductase [Anaerolineae bacterium]
MKKVTIGSGALVGALLTAPLMAVFYLGAGAFGLPFPPFDGFDWLARVLPGDAIRFGINNMVSLISGLNLGETSSTAKLMEQLLALTIFLLLGVAAGAVFFAFQRGRPSSASLRNGLLLGLAASLVLALLFSAVNQTATAPPLVSVIWLVAVSCIWGTVLGWVYRQLQPVPGARPVADGAAAGRSPAGPPVETGVINRRQFLMRVGNAAALITVSGAGLGALLDSGEGRGLAPGQTPGAPAVTLPDSLPNAGASLAPAPGTRPEYTPLADHYRIDISLIPPRIGEERWILPITGLVTTPLQLTLADLRENYTPVEQYVTMSCISNRVGGDLIGTTLWTGVSLQRVLADAGVRPEAAHLRITSQDGFHETLALDLVNADERIMLCYAWDNQPLTVEHGFPLRIYIPDRYGMKQPKWITGIEVVSEYEEGYWVRRGWDEVAQVRTTSVVDTVAANALVEQDGRMLVPVGGIAYAGARGISRVEVRMDDGEWQAAELRAPLSDTTWVIWRYDWPFEAGEHTFAVRAFDGQGVEQESAMQDTFPSGATGIHERSAELMA